jgi:hypothetical protein
LGKRISRRAEGPARSQPQRRARRSPVNKSTSPSRPFGMPQSRPRSLLKDFTQSRKDDFKLGIHRVLKAARAARATPRPLRHHRAHPRARPRPPRHRSPGAHVCPPRGRRSGHSDLGLKMVSNGKPRLRWMAAWADWPGQRCLQRGSTLQGKAFQCSQTGRKHGRS